MEYIIGKITTAWDASYQVLNKIVQNDFALHIAVNNTIDNVELLPDVRRYIRDSTNGFNLFKNNTNSHCFSINLKKSYDQDPYMGMHYSVKTGTTYSPSYTSTNKFDSLQLDIPPVWLRRWSRDYIEEVFLVEGGNEDNLDHEKALSISARYKQQFNDS